MRPVSETMRMARVGRFSAIEIGVALLLLGVVIVGVQGLAAGPVSGAAKAAPRPTALDLVEEQIERIRADPMFRETASRYSGTEESIEGWPGYVRETKVAATQDSTSVGVYDWLTVTVTVRDSSGRSPVSRTVTIGGP